MDVIQRAANKASGKRKYKKKGLAAFCQPTDGCLQFRADMQAFHFKYKERIENVVMVLILLNTLFLASEHYG